MSRIRLALIFIGSHLIMRNWRLEFITAKALGLRGGTIERLANRSNRDQGRQRFRRGTGFESIPSLAPGRCGLPGAGLRVEGPWPGARGLRPHDFVLANGSNRVWSVLDCRKWLWWSRRWRRRNDLGDTPPDLSRTVSRVSQH